jgi:hypothetical protein
MTEEQEKELAFRICQYVRSVVKKVVFEYGISPKLVGFRAHDYMLRCSHLILVFEDRYVESEAHRAWEENGRHPLIGGTSFSNLDSEYYSEPPISFNVEKILKHIS